MLGGQLALFSTLENADWAKNLKTASDSIAPIINFDMHLNRCSFALYVLTHSKQFLYTGSLKYGHLYQEAHQRGNLGKKEKNDAALGRRLIVRSLFFSASREKRALFGSEPK